VIPYLPCPCPCPWMLARLPYARCVWSCVWRRGADAACCPRKPFSCPRLLLFSSPSILPRALLFHPAPALDVARAAYTVFLHFLPLPLLGRHLAPSVQTTLLPGSPSALLDTRPPAHYHPDHPDHPGPDSFDPLATVAVPPPGRLLSIPPHPLPTAPAPSPGCACICVCVLAFACTLHPHPPLAPPLHSTGPTLIRQPPTDHCPAQNTNTASTPFDLDSARRSSYRHRPNSCGAVRFFPYFIPDNAFPSNAHSKKALHHSNVRHTFPQSLRRGHSLHVLRP
jgi:hypothetical protein